MQFLPSYTLDIIAKQTLTQDKMIIKQIIKYFLDQKFFGPILFGPNIFLDFEFFGPKILLDQRFFWTQIFFDQIFFWTQHFMDLRIVLTSHYFGPILK